MKGQIPKEKRENHDDESPFGRKSFHSAQEEESRFVIPPHLVFNRGYSKEEERRKRKFTFFVLCSAGGGISDVNLDLYIPN